VKQVTQNVAQNVGQNVAQNCPKHFLPKLPWKKVANILGLLLQLIKWSIKMIAQEAIINLIW
jgi:hypothetical protein